MTTAEGVGTFFPSGKEVISVKNILARFGIIVSLYPDKCPSRR